ncbi:NUDIX domain-containing protein [Candidatus Pacearchaeota archaeon]|nr:NUDIX domain-containing protein [Candidatus Pacearchaeota archaeon]
MDYAGVLIKREDGKMLFQLRDNNPNISNPDKWGIFGGGIEKQENSKEAGIRELNEELGLLVKKNNLKLVFKINLFFKKYFIFQTKIKDNQKLILKEGASMKFFSKKEILSKKNLLYSLRLFLLLYFFKIK